MKKIRVVLIGYGYWGKNILRCLMAEPTLEVVCVCDKNLTSTQSVQEIYPSLRVSNDFHSEIMSEFCDAIVIATPVETHFAIAKMAITNKKHVLVEKPICSSSKEAAELIFLAEAHSVTLMVDHTYLFHPVVSQIKFLIDNGDLGEISYLDSRRINLGLFQPDVDVVWDLAPHDFSIAQYLLGGVPAQVYAT
ncbi:Gfo/Idh/MocA family oxidoreductase, partial [Alphaproteobacteria bacterium]|nr:Gfo/Idh/MocA family oxidoreductase [Alphaproteobacteria bacterium]